MRIARRPHQVPCCPHASRHRTVERARRIVKELEDLVSFTTASREPLSSTLRMGAIPTVGPFLLPRVLPGLRETYSRLKLYLVEDITERLITSLHHGELDVVLLALPRDCGAVETVVLFEDPFVVALPQGHSLVKVASIKPQHLLSENLLLLKDGHCLRDHALTALRRLADQRLAEFEATSLPALVQMVDNGLGTTLLPTLAIDAGLFAGHQPGDTASAEFRAGTKDRSCLAPRYRASRRIPFACKRTFGSCKGGREACPSGTRVAEWTAPSCQRSTAQRPVNRRCT